MIQTHLSRLHQFLYLVRNCHLPRNDAVLVRIPESNLLDSLAFVANGIAYTERVQDFKRNTFNTICLTMFNWTRLLIDYSYAQICAIEAIGSRQAFPTNVSTDTSVELNIDTIG